MLDFLPVEGKLPINRVAAVHFDVQIGTKVLADFTQVHTASDGHYSAALQAGITYPGTHKVRIWYYGTNGAKIYYAWTPFTRSGNNPTWTIKAAANGLNSGSSWVGYGSINVSGVLTGAKANTVVHVWQYHVPTQTWTLLGKPKTNSVGAFSVWVSKMPRTGWYQYFADGGLRSAAPPASPYLNITHKAPQSTLVTGSQTIDSLTVGTLRGNYLPAVGQRVEFQVLSGGRWIATHASTVAPNGTASVPLSYLTSYLTSFKYRTVLVNPNGTRTISGTSTFTRAAQLRPVVRTTTAADVKYTFRAGCPVAPSNLRSIEMNYLGFDGRMKRGVLIVRHDLVTKTLAAFNRGLQTRFPIAQMTNPNTWYGDDFKMMAANNTSAFNCRPVAGNPYSMSLHAYGRAIDINTVQNPYKAPNGVWYPSATYATNRPATVKGLLAPTSSVVVAMKGQGFKWLSGYDWQHFEN